MTMTPSGIAKEDTLARRYGYDETLPVKSWTNNKTPLTADAIITCPVGKYIRLLWVQFIPDQDNSSANNVAISFEGATEYVYYGPVGSHWQVFNGAVDADVIIDLTNNQPMSFTIHYQEMTP